MTYISKTSNWFKKGPNGFQVKVVDIRGWICKGKGDLVCKRKLGRKSSESRRPLARPMGGRWSIIVVLDNRRNPSAGHEIYSSIGWSGYVWHKKGLYRSDHPQGSVVCMSKLNQYPVQCYEKTWQKPSYMIFHSSQWLRHDCVVWSIFVQASLTFNNQKIKRHEMKSRLLICLLLEIKLPSTLRWRVSPCLPTFRCKSDDHWSLTNQKAGNPTGSGIPIKQNESCTFLLADSVLCQFLG